MINHNTTIECATHSVTTARRHLMIVMTDLMAQSEDDLFPDVSTLDMIKFFFGESQYDTEYSGKVYIEGPIQLMQ
jgi:hypothetical protein